MNTLFELVSKTPMRQLTGSDGKSFNVCEAELRTLQAYPQSFIATCYDRQAERLPEAGSLVWAELHFGVRQHEGRKYQDVIARYILGL